MYTYSPSTLSKDLKPVAILALNQDNKLVLLDYPISGFSAPKPELKQEIKCEKLSVKSVTVTESIIHTYLRSNIGPKNTTFCNSKMISEATDLSSSNIRKVLQTLKNKGFIAVESQTFGRGMASQTEYRILPIQLTVKCEKLSVKSVNALGGYININNNKDLSQKKKSQKREISTNFKDQIAKLKIPELLSDSGVTYHKFLRLEGEITPDEIQQSLDHYHHDLKHKYRAVGSVVGYFMGCIRKGGYVSPQYEQSLQEKDQEIKRKLRLEQEAIRINLSQKYLSQITQKLAPISESYEQESFAQWKVENPHVQAELTRFLGLFKGSGQTSVESLAKGRYVKHEESVEADNFEEWKAKNKEMLGKLYFSKVKQAGMVSYQDLRELYLAWKVDPQTTKNVCETALRGLS